METGFSCKFFLYLDSISYLDAHYSQTYLCVITFNNNDYDKRKSKLLGNIYLYQLCSKTKNLREFCADYEITTSSWTSMSPAVERKAWQNSSGWIKHPKVTKVQITSKPYNSLAVKMEMKQPEGEPPISWEKLQLTSGAILFLRNTIVLDLSLLLIKMIGWYA